jgi:hypothetical protein
MEGYLGFRYIFWAELLVTIPSYVYYLDGYFGVGKGHRRNPPPGTHNGGLVVRKRALA